MLAQIVQAQSYAKTVSIPAEETVVSEALLWDKMEHQFGEIPQNIPATAEFLLTNNSDQPMIITKVKGSCGCTATYHDKEPIAPGTQTTIKATYNAKKPGAFIKYVSVTTTANSEPVKLKLSGTVINP